MADPNTDRAYEFAMGFIASSQNYREQFIERWREVLANFIVEPLEEDYGRSTSPYSYNTAYRGRGRNRIVLKDPETHKIVMSYASKLVRALLGERNREYIKAKPRGYEDAPQKAPTVQRYLAYTLGLPGHFRTFVEAIIDMVLFGTSVVEVTWHYSEREMPVRSVVSELGIELDEFTRMKIPVYDDVKITPIDVVDFYPDPARYRLEDMSGAAKRFKMNAIEANANAGKGIYNKAAVKRAVKNMGSQSSVDVPESFRTGMDQPTDRIAHSDFRDMIGYEYWGDVPWEDQDGSSRRVITILNNEVVRDIPWPLADPHLPWHALTINPVQGRFYGVSPAEIIRYDQDFADALKILLAEAVIRQVHPPIAFDPDAEVDAEAVRAWTPDALISARGGPAAVGALRYDAKIESGFGMMMGLKNSMGEGSGMTDAITGEPGPSREPATVGVQRVQMALDRPELATMVLENEAMPSIGAAILRRGQQFLDTEGLRLRIGEMPEPVWIGDIMGDFDIEFVGSRLGMSRQEKLQAYQTLAALATGIPPLLAQIPWDQLGSEVVGEILDLPEVAARMQDPMMVLKNLLLMQLTGQGGAGANGVPTKGEPPGMLAAQAQGTTSNVGG